MEGEMEERSVGEIPLPPLMVLSMLTSKYHYRGSTDQSGPEHYLVSMETLSLSPRGPEINWLPALREVNSYSEGGMKFGEIRPALICAASHRLVEQMESESSALSPDRFARK